MKFVKFSIFALTMGLFIASCGSSETETTETVDTAMTAPVEAAPMVEPTPVDTMSAAPVDTMTTTTTTTTAH